MTFKEKLEQIGLVQDQTKKHLKLMDAIVEEFGNDSEKFGIQLCLYPVWADKKAKEIEESTLAS